MIIDEKEFFTVLAKALPSYDVPSDTILQIDINKELMLMTDTPDDIRAKAEALWTSISNQRTDGMRIEPVTAIAHAMMKERMRCALIAREEGADPFVAKRILSPDRPPPTEQPSS